MRWARKPARAIPAYATKSCNDRLPSGVLSTLQLAPVAASNGVSDLRKMLEYMRTHGGPDVTLAAGTEAFTGSLVG